MIWEGPMYMLYSIIDDVFAACCGIMYGMADMFGRTGSVSSSVSGAGPSDSLDMQI